MNSRDVSPLVLRRCRPHGVDAADLVLEVLELGRGADLVRGELVERPRSAGSGGRGRRPARRCPRSRTRCSHGRTRSASRASYQQSPARTTSTSGGASSRTSRWTIATRWPLARALRAIAATAKGSMSAAVDRGRARPHRGDRAQTRAGREVEHAPAGDRLRVLAQVARDGEAAAPGERPVGECRVRVVRLDLDGMPERQDLVGEMEPDLLEARHGAQPGVSKDERASRGRRPASQAGCRPSS